MNYVDRIKLKSISQIVSFENKIYQLRYKIINLVYLFEILFVNCKLNLIY